MADRRGAIALKAARAAIGLLSDEALMARIAAGDEDAFAVFVARHLDRLIAVAARVLGAREAAEDAVQEAMLELWRHAGRFDPGRAKATTWLYRILVNRCLDAKRRRRPAAPLAAAGDPVDPGPGPEAAAVQASDAAIVQAALDALPPRQRAAIALVYYQGLSNREAAAVMDVNVKALESLLTRGRAALRERLQ